MKVVTIDDKEYPILLRNVGKEAPKQLYYKGKWDNSIFENCLAVVGSRQMTTYGKQVVQRIVGEVAAAGLTIVSGFMYGVDAWAHKMAVRAGGRTIAVMPCGIDLIHPEYQQDLYVEILNNGGLIISEYKGNMQPSNWTYPRRNRIVAGISKATLVVEAGEKSGALITANFAKKFKRKVFAVPGPITSETSKGTLRLIREGAAMVTSAQDILEFFGIKSSLGKIEEDKKEVKGTEEKILEQLQREPLSIDELSRVLRIQVSKLGVILSMMELQGLIRQEGLKYYLNLDKK